MPLAYWIVSGALVLVALLFAFFEAMKYDDNPLARNYGGNLLLLVGVLGIVLFIVVPNVWSRLDPAPEPAAVEEPR